MTSPAAPSGPICWVLVPIKAPGRGKSRLAPTLNDADRERLVEKMLAHVLTTTLACPEIDRILVLGPTRRGFEGRIEWLEDADAGNGASLNRALDTALPHIARRPGVPDRLIVLPGDLPQVTVHDITLLAALPDGVVGIAPDRHGTGTNALSLPLPEAAGFGFHFGIDSAACHRKGAENRGLTTQTIHSPGLAKDIDEPADLVDVEHLFSAAR